MDDVAAVAAAIAGKQLDDRIRCRLAILTVPGTRAAREFLHDRAEHEPADRDGHERPDVAHPGDQQDQQHEAAARQRDRKLAPEIGDRRAPPGNQRSDARHGEQRETERDVHLIEERRADRDLRALDRLGENREQRAPQNREGDTDQQQVIEQETRLAAHHRFERRVRLEQRQPRGVQREAECGREDQEDEEEVADTRLRERVHARDHAGARDERAEDRQEPGADDQSEIPLLQHPALFLNHDRVEECGHHEPRQQRGVFHGIPGPVAAPPELDVRPPHADQQTDAQKQPGDERPFADRDQPIAVEPFRQQRGDREGERNRDRDVAEVQHGRMEDHPRILQLRVHAPPVERHEREPLEWVRGEQHHRDEKRRHGTGDCGDVGQIDAMAPARHRLHERREQAQHRRPEEEATLLPRVECGPEIERREIAAGVGRDVLETEIVAEDRDLERDDGDHQRAEHRECRVARALLQIRATLGRGPAGKSRDRSPQADQEGEPEGEVTEQRHLCLGDGFVPRPALRQHVGRVNHPIALQSPLDDHLDGVGEGVGRKSLEHDRVVDGPIGDVKAQRLRRDLFRHGAGDDARPDFQAEIVE